MLVFDHLHFLPRRARMWCYLYLAVHFARLAAWYAIDEKWGKA